MGGSINAISKLLIGCLLTLSCVNQDEVSTVVTSDSRRKTTEWKHPNHEGLYQKQKKKVTKFTREWSYRNGQTYRDSNGDGIVDFQAVDEDPYLHDDYTVFKEDTDFDGFYDREYRAGGYSGAVTYEKQIREPVSQIHKIYPPTRTIPIRNAGSD